MKTNNKEQLYKENGRGLMLVSAFSDQIKYNKKRQ